MFLYGLLDGVDDEFTGAMTRPMGLVEYLGMCEAGTVTGIYKGKQKERQPENGHRKCLILTSIERETDDRYMNLLFTDIP